MSTANLNPLDLKNPAIRTLHLAWVAFFLTFVVWFNHAPLMGFIKEAFNLTPQQVKALLILNVALTIPARIVIGILVDKLGPRNVFTGLLVASSFICFGFACAQSFEQLALLRFLLGFVGAGGIGFELVTTIKLFEFRETAVILLVIFGMVTIIDYASTLIRSRIY